jgi:hypothetical protein
VLRRLVVNADDLGLTVRNLRHEGSRLAEVPHTKSYPPRWWMEVDLALADDVDSEELGALDW